MAATYVMSVLLVATERTGGSVSRARCCARGNGCVWGGGGERRGGRVPACAVWPPLARRDARVPQGGRGGGREERICQSGKSASNSTCGRESPYSQPSPFFPFPPATLQPAVGLSFSIYEVRGVALGLPSFLRTSPWVGCQL